MIQLVPKSLCSWDFWATGLSGGTASVEYYWASEQGRILVANTIYEIRKHGMFSGHWTLERAGFVVAEADKPSAMFRSFDVRGESVDLTVRAEMPLTRVFEIEVAQRVIIKGKPPALLGDSQSLTVPGVP